MLLPGSQLLEMPVMSLQTGKELARTRSAIVNPHNLSIIAYLIEGQHLDFTPSYLRIADIRELGSLGMIVDSSEEFITTDDIITDKPIYDLDYSLEGKHVVDDRGTKVGKVSEYNIDADSFVIEQLTVKKPLFKSFTDDEVLVHRSQIVEVNDSTIVIKSGKVKTKKAAAESRHYVNPFRQTSPQPETAKTK